MATIMYAENKKYFKPISYKPAVICIVVGVLLLFGASAGPVILGLLLIGVGIYLIYNQTADRPGDGMIDRQINAVLDEAKARALDKLNLDDKEVELLDPIIAGGQSYNSGSQVRKGTDGVYRSSECESVVIFFAEQELHAYKFRVSLVDRGRDLELTDVYFYRDVVSVSTRSDSSQFRPGLQKVFLQSERLLLTTSGGTSVECSMSATSDKTDVDVRAARQLIRDKKLHAL